MYVVSWATKWTCRGSCHGSWAAWWTNISAYRVPLLRVFLGRETLIVLWETWKRKKRNLKQNLKKKFVFQNASIKSPCNTVSYHKGLRIQFSVCFYLIGFTSVKIINVNLLTPPKNNQPFKLAVDIKVLLFVDQSMASFCVRPQCGVDAQLTNKDEHVRHPHQREKPDSCMTGATILAHNWPAVWGSQPGRVWCSWHLWGCCRVWCTRSRTSPSRCGAHRPQTPPRSGWWTMFSETWCSRRFLVSLG